MEFHLQYGQEMQQYLLELCADCHRGYRNSTLGFFLILHSEDNNTFPCDVHNVLLINQTLTESKCQAFCFRHA